MKSVEHTIKNCLLRFCLSVMVVALFSEVALCETKTIIAFGDSLTEGCDVHLEGYGDCGWIGGYGYQKELLTLLTQNDWDHTVNNFGRGGETTTEGVNRLDSVLGELCNQGADYILLLEGTNDLLHGADGMNVKFNLGVMVDKSRAKGIEPLLATIPPDSEPDHSYKNIPLMNDYIRQLAVEKNIVLVDQYNALEPRWDVYTNPRGCYNDLLHPNSTGFDAMGSVWYDSLSDLPVQTGESDASYDFAIVNGFVDVTDVQFTDLVFQYGEDVTKGKTVVVDPDSIVGTGIVSVAARIEDLKPETTYYYRLISINGNEFNHGGRTYSFTTRSSPGVSSWLMLLLNTP